VKQALEAADGDELAARLDEHGSLTLDLGGDEVELSAEEVEVRLIEREGLATQGDHSLLLALDTELTADLIAEGWAREVIHRIQSARKAADLDYADRIRVRYRAGTDLAAAVEAYRNHIADETLAIELARDDTDSSHLEPSPIEDMDFALAIEKTER
jgi:isoleucyl-tRNA synthetase